MHSRVALKEY